MAADFNLLLAAPAAQVGPAIKKICAHGAGNAQGSGGVRPHEPPYTLWNHVSGPVGPSELLCVGEEGVQNLA